MTVTSSHVTSADTVELSAQRCQTTVMSNEIVVSQPSEITIGQVVQERLERLQQTSLWFADASMSAATRRAYNSDAKDFQAWCAQHGFAAMPALPETVRLYITALASGEHGDTRKSSTIRRRLTAISKWHEINGHEALDPTKAAEVKRVWKGIRKTLGTTPTQKRALTREMMRRCLQLPPRTIVDARNNALLAFGFESAMRRSEIASLEVSWLTFGTKGVLVRFPRSKTNQEGEFEAIAVMRRSDGPCPVVLLEEWLRAARIATGSVFRQFDRLGGRMFRKPMTGYDIARLVKRVVRAAGLGNVAEFSGHSLRRGFVTTAHREGAGVETIMETTRHEHIETVRRYIEQDELLAKIGTVTVKDV